MVFKVVFQNTTLVLLQQFIRRLRLQTYQYISTNSAKNQQPNIAKFIFTRAKQSCTWLFTFKPTACVIIFCVGQLQSLYSHAAIMDGVSLLRHHMYCLNWYGCSVALFNDMQYTDNELYD
jgi:hypothetical protein